MQRHRNSIEYEVSGRYALFSEAATRVGGEKFSYQVPTYQALKGITESIYWKPTFMWVIAHFEWNDQREDLVADRDENKHHNIALRSVQKGGRRDIFLGTRECQGYVEPCEFGSGEGFYDGYGEWNMGYMFHGFTYPDENEDHDFIARFWSPVMSDGIIEFERPESTKLDGRIIRKNQSVKEFALGSNLQPVGEE